MGLFFYSCISAMMPSPQDKVAAGIAANRAKTEKKELDYIRLHPVVKYEDGYMWVKNKDPFTWANVEMTINDKFFGGGYSCDRRLIPSEQYVKIPIGEFADSDQNRFNLLKIALICSKSL
jgi:hypothetical protein